MNRFSAGVIAAYTLLFAPSVRAQPYGSCYRQTFQAVCERMKASPTKDLKTSDGEVVANPFGNKYDAPASAPLGLRQRTSEEMQALFNRAKRTLIRQLFPNRKVEELSDTSRAIHDRILGTVYLDRASSLRKGFCARNEDDNAAYFGQTVHGIVFCDDMTRNPTVSILEVLSHEITHGLDTVNMERSYYLSNSEPLQYVPRATRSWSNRRALQAIASGTPKTLPGVRKYPFQNAINVFLSGGRELPKMKTAHLKEAIPDSFGALAIKSHFEDLITRNPEYVPTAADLIAPFGSTLEEACGLEGSPMQSSESYASFALRFEAIYMADPFLAEVYNCPWLSTDQPLHQLN